MSSGESCESSGDIGLKIVIESAARDLGVEQLKNEQYDAVKSFVISKLVSNLPYILNSHYA